jgi:hypothetical protein
VSAPPGKRSPGKLPPGKPPPSEPPPKSSLAARILEWVSRLFGIRNTEAKPLPQPDPPEHDSTATSPETIESDLPDRPDVEVAQRVNVRVDELLQADFERNLREPVRIGTYRLRGLHFFRDDTVWELQPSVNVLLGRNGYGKSLMLRSLAGMLQRDAAVTGALFTGASSSARVELDLTRQGRPERLARDHEVFLRDSVGRVPLLAIPDSRFTDRSTTTIAPPATLDLATDGAKHFLEQTPYQSAVDALLGGLAIDYSERGTFELPPFQLLAGVVQRLTERPFGFARIERVTRTGYKIWVRSEGLGDPVLIQYASQGTLSVLTIFGLIHSFLHDVAVAAGTRERFDYTGVANQEAIVIIDELDAHLHPIWQQKIRDLLTETFPYVQFIVSAHSPFIVAGCGPREVSVLRRPDEQGFLVDQLDEDFVGASTQKLYTTVFEVEDLDEAFLGYALREATELPEQRERESKRIDALYKRREKGALTPLEELELDRLVRDRGRISRVVKVREERRMEKQTAEQLRRKVSGLESELERMRRPPKAGSEA